MAKLFSAEVRYSPPERSHCNACGGSRNHDVLHAEETTWNDGDEYRWIGGGDTYQIIRCKGCDRIHFRHDSWFSEATDADGEPIPSLQYYPPATSRSQPDWLTSMNGPFWSQTSVVASLMKEVYVSLHAGSFRLSAMGIRALLEHIMIEKVGDKGTFEKTIAAFFEAGYVAPIDQSSFRDKLIEAGHAAMHRDFAPELDDLAVLMQLTEALVERIYVHPHISARLEGKIPERKRSERRTKLT